jgi:hypothetical protein
MHVNIQKGSVMNNFKSKSLDRIEGKMEGIDENSIRYRVLQNAKNFKTSWMELGQSLVSVYKDKLFKEWGFISFDGYAAKEIGIRKQTALKLMQSYYFLVKEEPVYLMKQKESSEAGDAATVPSYEAVNVLRAAKAKKIDEVEYRKMRDDVLEKGRDAVEVKKDLTTIMKQREEDEPEEARRKKKVQTIRRFLTTLKTLRRDIEMSKLVSSSIVKETQSLINKIEMELGEEE